jgi:hypothetical protein
MTYVVSVAKIAGAASSNPTSSHASTYNPTVLANNGTTMTLSFDDSQYKTSIGTFTVTVTANDNVAQPVSQSFTFTVIGNYNSLLCFHYFFI